MISSVKWIAWNVWLALIPVILGYFLRFIATRKVSKWQRLAAIAVVLPLWFLFLPNTCYLMTEWRHFFFALDQSDLFLRTQLDSRLFIPLLAYSVFYILYSGFGMMMFALAIRPLERLAIRAKAPLWIWAVPFFVLVSLGVYLGLVLRFNSWDMLYRGNMVWAAALSVTARPKLAAFIIGFGMFLWGAYEVLDIWLDAASERWQKFIARRN